MTVSGLGLCVAAIPLSLRISTTGALDRTKFSLPKPTEICRGSNRENSQCHSPNGCILRIAHAAKAFSR